MSGKKLWQQGMVFGGELMTCRECGKQHKSDPKVESGWTMIEVDGKRFYICPECWSGSTKIVGSK